MSRTQRFQLRTNAPRLPSGETVSGAPLELVGPPPPLPRPPPGPFALGAVAVVIRAPAHSVACAGHACRARVRGSITTISLPFNVVLRYQNRPSPSHAGFTAPPTTRPVTFAPRNFAARS